MEKLEEWEKVLETKREAEDLKRLEDSEGWNRLLARLARHLTHKEKVKANLIRSAKFDEGIYMQGFIDGINFAMDEPNRIISTANPSGGEEI